MTYTLDDRFVGQDTTVFMSGTQALARLALDQLRADRAAGFRTAALVTGYPGSPLGGVDAAARAAASLAPELPIRCKPALNEEFAATALMGSQLAATRPDRRHDGVVGLWYGKAPGIDRAADALRHGVYAGTARLGGVVVLAGDDPVAKSSTLPSSSVGVLSDLHIPLLYPGDPAEALHLGRHAIALSRFCGLWTALKIVSDVADGTMAMDVDSAAFESVVPDATMRYDLDPDGLLLTPHTLDIERNIYEVRYELAKAYASANQLNAVTVRSADDWIGIASSGITYHEVRAALGRLGLPDDRAIARAGIRLINLRMPIPFDRQSIVDFAAGLTEVMVIEEKHPHLELLIKESLYDRVDRPLVVGKHDDLGVALVPGFGGLDADLLVPLLRRRLEGRLGDRLAPVVQHRPRIPVVAAQRTPYYCSGCPHNRSTEVPSGSLLGVGIGCHTMTMMMEPERVGEVVAITPMGNEGVQWIGMSDFVETRHLFQNLGDGTYFHSGQLAITAAIASGVNITYKLLYNGAVAMTGGQHPEGQLSVADLTRVLLAQGVRSIIVTTDDISAYKRAALPSGVRVWHRDRIVEAQRELAALEGVTVMIHDQGCAAELRRSRKRGLVEAPTKRTAINHRICEGCGDCGRVSNCLSVQPVETAFGRKTAIDQSTCNLDFSCVDGDCPSFMVIETAPSRLDRWSRRARRRQHRRPDRAASSSLPVELARLLDRDLPNPPVASPLGELAVRIAGIGGTGVVTVAQVVGTAATLAGYEVRGLDQVGLSQKAGPVVSDLRLVGDARALHTNRVGDREADLLLALDPLVATLPKTLATVSRDRTVVVGTTSLAPTGEMVRHPERQAVDVGELQQAIESQARAAYWADLDRLAAVAFGSTMSANVIALGMAVQTGALPLDGELVERAIGLNGAAVTSNLRAFRLGRAAIAFADQLADVLAIAPPLAPATALGRGLEQQLDDLTLGSIRERVAYLAAELVEYQSERYARGFVAAVGRVAAAERAVDVDSHALTAAYAENLFRLMAYKDEFEVARLLLDPDGREAARQLAGDSGRIRYQLHPPVLKSLGMERKISVGTWADPLFKLLASGKVLRGTALDPFGRAAVRRLERELPDLYRTAVDDVLEHLTVDNLPAATRLAGLPDAVRGYEDLKVERAAEFRAQLAAARAALVTGRAHDLPASAR